MEVRINDLPVEMTFENEETLKDVVNSLESWGAERGLIFAGVEMEEEFFPREDIPHIAIADCESANFIFQSKSDMVYDTVSEGINYCHRILNFFQSREEGNGEDRNYELENLIAGLDWLQDVFRSVGNLLNVNFSEFRYRDSSVQDYIDKISEFQNALSQYVGDNEGGVAPGFDSELFNNLKEIFTILLMSDEMKELVIGSIDSPDVLISNIKKISELLPDQLKFLEEAAVAYQTGNDKEGVEKLFEFMDFVFGYTRTCDQIASVFNVDYNQVEVDGVSLNEKNRELQNLLTDTLEIVENNDMISLADILEYEMVEALENLEAYIDVVLENIGG